VLAVGSYWTFAHRMYHTWREVLRTEVAATLTATGGDAKAAADASKYDDERRATTQVVGEPQTSR
jgi:hypothetical protein